ncbi:helix-turn-helix transcriptional regulator [Seonamhaeicola sediminis]|uniref:Helix-turn-helix transcriptional regulator n=1 Tax=Seonamhaeicola sediminis TaxID=2528206 RepID=A0A562YF32_9FLAO|nr:helix-turn-helix domain-containing protein [Seonamhaeicola sediminis]TWO33277.1 helix-turn-helix transcriptional regulator [Seonamhaeicola sediminis]
MSIVSIVNFLLIAGVVQGFGFNLVTVFIRKKFNKTILFLNLIILFISLNNLQRWLIEKGLISDLFVIQQLLVPWYLLIIPMFYAFTTHFLKVENKVRGFIKLSLIIFVAELIIRLSLIAIVYHSVPERNPQIIKTYTLIEDVFNLMYMIFLFVNACVIIFRRHHLTEYILSFDDLTWMKWFIRLGTIVLGLWALALTVRIFSGNDDAYIFLRFGTSILLYWLGYQGFYRYSVVQDRISLRNSIETDQVLIGSSKIAYDAKKEDDFLNEKHLKDFEKIRSYIVDNKFYLDPLLSMESIATDMRMSKSYFSKLINSYSNFNFSDFINSLRVEQAKKFLSNNEFSEYTIVAIGLECGFNSKSTFYSAFKKFTSKTPSAFREQY